MQSNGEAKTIEGEVTAVNHEEVADYSAFSMEELSAEMQKLVVADKISSVKNSVEEVSCISISGSKTDRGIGKCW